jgi:phospholipid transport system substrate-binding protein
MISIYCAAIWAASASAAAPGPETSGAQNDPDSTVGPRAVIETSSHEMLEVLRDLELTQVEKSRRVEQIAQRDIDFDTLTHLSLGQAWRDLTPAQQSEFKAEFQKHVLAIISRGTERYSGQYLVFGEDRTEPPRRAGGSPDWIVEARVMGRKDGADRQAARLEFRLRRNEQQWRVIDISIEGISLAVGFRAQFLAVMKDGGIERVLQILREKNSAHNAASAAPR